MNNPTPPAPGQMPPTGDPPGQTPPTPTPSGQTPPGQQRTDISSLPPDIQDYIRDLRREGKTLREAAEARQRAEQGQFKQLAEQHEARVKELEPIATRYSALSELVAEQIKAEVKDWPASVKALDPGKDAPIETRLDWMSRARTIVSELATQARATLPGNRPNPSPQGQRSRDELVAANKSDLKKQRTYGI